MSTRYLSFVACLIAALAFAATSGLVSAKTPPTCHGKQATIKDLVVKEGDVLSIDGTSGEVVEGGAGAVAHAQGGEGHAEEQEPQDEHVGQVDGG